MNPIIPSAIAAVISSFPHGFARYSTGAPDYARGRGWMAERAAIALIRAPC